MKAIRFHEFGGTEVLKFEDVPDPKPRADQVLVRVKACALNHLDLFIRNGLPGVKLPHISGADVSGDVAQCGEYITDLNQGQRVLLAPMVFCNHCPACMAGRHNFCAQFSVLGYLNDGGNAEYVAVPRCNVLPIPDSADLTYDEAASMPLVFVTAWHMLVGRCGIKPGDFVLVLGAGSGVGSAAIQIAKLFNARVIATAGDETKMVKARDLGADYVIDHYN
jgi:NADPH:quinone reductase-like Zn-dependent oxidoreductase